MPLGSYSPPFGGSRLRYPQRYPEPPLLELPPSSAGQEEREPSEEQGELDDVMMAVVREDEGFSLADISRAMVLSLRHFHQEQDNIQEEIAQIERVYRRQRVYRNP